VPVVQAAAGNSEGVRAAADVALPEPVHGFGGWGSR